MILPAVISVAETQITVDDSIPLQSYNHRLSLKMKKESQMKQLVNITPQALDTIVQNTCGEKLQTKRLTHRRQLLFYRVYTEKCVLDINALDGKIIEKECSTYE
jgi:hypothetical protein